MIMDTTTLSVGLIVWVLQIYSYSRKQSNAYTQLHLRHRLSMFYTLSQNCQHFFEKQFISMMKQSVWEHKNGIKIVVGQAVLILKLLIKN